MPIKHPDPFTNAIDGLNPGVNPYVALLREASTNGALPLASGPDLAEFPGRWRQRIEAYHERSRPYKHIVVEIGCHLGKTLLAMAKAYPDTLFIGADITFKRVVTTAQRIRKQGLDNAFCILANAKAVNRLFAAGELAGCVLFFPDPWIKKESQGKHRLVDATFAANLAESLAPGGFCWLKTDQPSYYESAIGHLSAAGFRAAGGELPGILGDDFTSAFEQRFHAQKVPTYGGKWLKAEAGAGLLL